MKHLFILCLSAFVLTNGFAQSKAISLDKSPMDMSYYPNIYPILKIQDKPLEPLVARVIYSRPQKNGRVIFGDLVEYGKVWRLGANEATEIEFYKPVKIGGVRIKKGRYTIYSIPFEQKWTIILNKETDTWGAFKYDELKDVVRLDVPVLTQAEITDYLSMSFEKSNNGAYLVVLWDAIKINLPIIF